MSKKPRIRRPKAERVSQIIEAAREVFTENGYDAATLSDIAAKVGIVEGAIYRHFQSKRDLLERVLADFYKDLIVDVAAHLPGIQGARNQLRYLIWRQLTAFADDPEYCWLVVKEIRPDRPLYQSAVQQFNRQYTAFCVGAVEYGITTGDIQSGVSPQLVRDMIYGSIEHLMWRHLLAGSSIDPESQADELTRMLISGIASDSP